MRLQGKCGELIHDEKDAREVLERWRASGRALHAWCREQGIAGHSLYRWYKKLTRSESRALPAVVPRLVEVRVTPEPVEPVVYDVVFANGRTLRIGSRFDEGTVARLVGVLERAC